MKTQKPKKPKIERSSRAPFLSPLSPNPSSESHKTEDQTFKSEIQKLKPKFKAPESDSLRFILTHNLWICVWIVFRGFPHPRNQIQTSPSPQTRRQLESKEKSSRSEAFYPPIGKASPPKQTKSNKTQKPSRSAIRKTYLSPILWEIIKELTLGFEGKRRSKEARLRGDVRWRRLGRFGVCLNAIGWGSVPRASVALRLLVWRWRCLWCEWKSELPSLKALCPSHIHLRSAAPRPSSIILLRWPLSIPNLFQINCARTKIYQSYQFKPKYENITYEMLGLQHLYGNLNCLECLEACDACFVCVLHHLWWNQLACCVILWLFANIVFNFGWIYFTFMIYFYPTKMTRIRTCFYRMHKCPGLLVNTLICRISMLNSQGESSAIEPKSSTNQVAQSKKSNTWKIVNMEIPLHKPYLTTHLDTKTWNLPFAILPKNFLANLLSNIIPCVAIHQLCPLSTLLYSLYPYLSWKCYMNDAMLSYTAYWYLNLTVESSKAINLSILELKKWNHCYSVYIKNFLADLPVTDLSCFNSEFKCSDSPYSRAITPYHYLSSPLWNLERHWILDLLLLKSTLPYCYNLRLVLVTRITVCSVSPNICYAYGCRILSNLRWGITFKINLPTKSKHKEWAKKNNHGLWKLLWFQDITKRLMHLTIIMVFFYFIFPISSIQHLVYLQVIEVYNFSFKHRISLGLDNLVC